MNWQSLLAEYGSPIYVYDLVRVRDAYAALRRALPDRSLLYYSLKANPHPALVAELGRLGCRAEISSSGELRTVLARAVPATCLYTGPGKTFHEISFALQSGVRYFSVDSPADVDRVARAAESVGRPARLLLRINPDQLVADMGLVMSGAPSQFGADIGWVRETPEAFVGTSWAKLAGFHIYMGTNITAVAILLETFKIASDLVAELSALFDITPEIVDLGGGFGHPFATSREPHDFSALRLPLTQLLDDRLPTWRAGRPAVAFEAGRYLVASAGTLLCTVQDVKVSQGRSYMVLDTGINHLGGMAGLRRIPRVGVHPLPIIERAATEPLHDAHIVGPLCTPLDHLANGASLPKLSPGDRLAIPNVGAYGLTASLLGFLSRELPVEIVLDGDEIVEVSQMVITRCDK